jgi:hypothetical protein
VNSCMNALALYGNGYEILDILESRLSKKPTVPHWV